MFGTSFNQPIRDYLRSQKHGNGMFLGPLSINLIDVEFKVTNMAYMFRDTPFNQPIGSWNVSSVTNMSGHVFYGTPFNQPIGDWNVSSVT